MRHFLASPVVAGCVLALGAHAQSDHRAELDIGPLQLGSSWSVDVRSTLPNAQVRLLRGAQLTPNVPLQLHDPVLQLGAQAGVVVRSTDQHGRLRITTPPLASVAGSARMHVQAVVQQADGTWIASPARSVRRNAVGPFTAHLDEQGAARLPAGFDTVSAEKLEAGDLDRDGDQDLVLATAAGLALWINDGAGYFQDETSTRLSAAHVSAHVTLVDLDLDGDLDLLCAGAWRAGVQELDRAYVNDGSGHFTPLVGFPLGNGRTAGFECGDVDHDGDLDLFVAISTENHGPFGAFPARMYRNQQGVFVLDAAFAALAWNDGVASTTSLRLGDIDGDGDLDLYVTRADSQALTGTVGEPNLLLINDGGGAFQDETSARIATIHEDDSMDARLVDLDHDGDLDLVVLNSVQVVASTSSGDLYLNQGGLQGGVQGTFVEHLVPALEQHVPGSDLRLGLRVADIDADGDPDVLISVHDWFPSSRQLLFVNQGGGQGGQAADFELASWYAPGSFISADALPFDFDLDGDLDLAVAANGVLSGDPTQAHRLRLYENQVP